MENTRTCPIELHSESQKMENMSCELQEAFQHIQQQSQNASMTSNHAQTLNSENIAVRTVADQLPNVGDTQRKRKTDG